MNYNVFRIWIGRIFGVLVLLLIKDRFNYYALLLVILGSLIRTWASGYIHKDEKVTTSGPYKFLRHPLYLGSFFNGLGFILFINAWWLVLLYIPVYLIVYYRKTRLEEEYLLNKFGDQYKVYQKDTPMFIPAISKIGLMDKQTFGWNVVIRNREHLNIWGIILIIAAMVIYKDLIRPLIF